ncbi:MAG: hypothetical protein FWH29_03035 [Methanobrevibacter sp.]|nr:hypothetical protein [Methanobrevibacter sp.]
MPFIAQNHFQFILEVSLILFSIIVFFINLVPTSLTVVTFISLLVSALLTISFGADLILLFLSFGHYELTHQFGPIALLAIITSLASLTVMEESGVNVKGLKNIIYALLIGVSVFGGLMHRSFLFLWIIGLFIGYFLMSKSFRQKSFLTIKRIFLFLGIGATVFAVLEILSFSLNMEVFSPMLRITRIEENSISSLKMVLDNTQLIGHNPNSTFWGSEGTGFADGYISLPMKFILLFGLSFPLFYGVLVTKKDIIDYMLPGIFGYAFDFGYIVMLGLLIFTIITIVLGLKMLVVYRTRREMNNKKYLGKEVLLIGSLTAFTAQALIGLFIFNRTINGAALVTFIFLASMVLAHTISLKRD